MYRKEKATLPMTIILLQENASIMSKPDYTNQTVWLSMAHIDSIENASPIQGSSSNLQTPDPVKICGVGHLTL